MNALDFLKAELTRAEDLERVAGEQADIAKQYIANHARAQVIVAHLRNRLAQETASPAKAITRDEANALCNRDRADPLPAEPAS